MARPLTEYLCMEGIEPGCWRFLVAAVYDCRISASSGSRKAPLQEACGAARREFSFGGHRPPLQGEPLFAYFFFAFLAVDFLPPEDLDADAFFEPIMDSDFNLAFADFEAEDFLESLPFFSTF